MNSNNSATPRFAPGTPAVYTPHSGKPVSAKPVTTSPDGQKDDTALPVNPTEEKSASEEDTKEMTVAEANGFGSREGSVQGSKKDNTHCCDDRPSA